MWFAQKSQNHLMDKCIKINDGKETLDLENFHFQMMRRFKIHKNRWECKLIFTWTQTATCLIHSISLSSRSSFPLSNGPRLVSWCFRSGLDLTGFWSNDPMVMDPGLIVQCSKVSIIGKVINLFDQKVNGYEVKAK